MFAQKLKTAMAERGISQTELAGLSGVSKAGISQYIHGVNKPRRKAVAAIAAVLDVPMSYFEDEPKPKAAPDSPLPRTLKTAQAAELMGVCPEMIRINLQNGRLPFGYALRGKRNRFSYYISTRKFMEYTGVCEPEVLSVL